MNWYLMIPLVVGLICALFGYLLGRLTRGQKTCNDCVDYRTEIKRLEAALKTCNDQKAKMNASLASQRPSENLFNAAMAKNVFGRTIKENDLTLIEGIGPKIQQLFHNNGIKTWKALGSCSKSKCQTILDGGGDAYKMHVPGTWPEQAYLAYKGKWQRLLDWQDELDGGK